MYLHQLISEAMEEGSEDLAWREELMYCINAILSSDHQIDTSASPEDLTEFIDGLPDDIRIALFMYKVVPTDPMTRMLHASLSSTEDDLFNIPKLFLITVVPFLVGVMLASITSLLGADMNLLSQFLLSIMSVF